MNPNAISIRTKLNLINFGFRRNCFLLLLLLYKYTFQLYFNKHSKYASYSKCRALTCCRVHFRNAFPLVCWVFLFIVCAYMWIGVLCVVLDWLLTLLFVERFFTKRVIKKVSEIKNRKATTIAKSNGVELMYSKNNSEKNEKPNINRPHVYKTRDSIYERVQI